MSRFDRKKPVQNEGYLINKFIPDKVVDVVDNAGNVSQGVSIREALQIAEDAGLDLVKVGEKDGRTITKVMDFGKFLYERKKKMSKSKKTQKIVQIKEIKMRSKIGPGDYEIKLNNAVKFLQEGKRVKFTLQFRGRQPVSIREVGTNFFKRLREDLATKELGTLVEEKESMSGSAWSKIFYLKS